MNRTDIKSLPINYALLEITEKNNPSKCPKHGLEYVAYCNDEDLVLCGACIFDHKSHNCILLTDAGIETVSEKKKIKLKKEEEGILNVRKDWSDNLDKLKKQVNEIEECVDIHKSGILNMEKKMIKEIEEGRKICINELLKVSDSDNIKSIYETLKEKISCIDDNMTNIQQKLENFEELSVAEKLVKNHFLVNDELPSIGPAISLLEKLKVSIDYKQAIQNSKFLKPEYS